MHVDKNAGVALFEMNALMEEHRRVAMRVEGNNAAMEVLCQMKLGGLAHYPLKDRQSAFEPFGMPLHAHDALLLIALDGLDGTIGGGCRHPKTLTGSTECLMVERIHKDILSAINPIKFTVLMKRNAVRQLFAGGILRMLDGGRRDVLRHMTVEGHGQRLNATTDAQHGNLPVIGQPGDEQFGQITLAIDMTKSGRRLLATP